MADDTAEITESPVVERGELVQPVEVARGDGSGPDSTSGGAAANGLGDEREYVTEPAKVMRVGSMIKQLLDEVRSTELDEPSRIRLREIYEMSVRELGSALSPDLRDELSRLAFPFGDETTPTDTELRIAQAQLVGWLEGLFHGIQATLFSQQMVARQQLEKMRGELPAGTDEQRPGTYL